MLVCSYSYSIGSIVKYHILICVSVLEPASVHCDLSPINLVLSII